MSRALVRMTFWGTCPCCALSKLLRSAKFWEIHVFKVAKGRGARRKSGTTWSGRESTTKWSAT
eukprot:scaffold243923_cov59-Attheya_sp.AAC.1